MRINECDEILIGKVFGRWKIIGFADNKIYKCGVKSKIFICECQCENKTIKNIIKNNLLSGKSKSCGCLQKELNKTIYKKYNTYDLSGDYGIGYTSNTNEPFYFDLEDYDKIKDYYWRKNSNNYICSTDPKTNKTISLHRLLFDLTTEDNEIIDHINYNAKFDNRKSNLRTCSSQENNMNKGLNSNNKSGVIGVSYRSISSKWHSAIGFNHRTIHLGDYSDFNEAVIVRLKKEKELFKEFAPQKHLYEKYGIN